MRIWFIHQNAYAPSHSASTRHFELARELTHQGHEVLIVASSFYHKARQETRLADGELSKKETIDGVQYLWLRTPAYSGNSIARLWNMLVFTFRVWRRVGLKDEPTPDVVIGSSPHLFSPWAALQLAKRFKKPFVLEIRDIWPAVPIEMGGMSRWHPLVIVMAWLEKLYYRKAERVISILPFADRHIQQVIGRSDHVVWIPNGSPLDAITEPRNHTDPLTFMYAGAHSLYSGLDVVLDAAELLKQEGWGNRVKIRLVGDGPEKARLMASAEQRQLDMIRFEDPVPKSEVFSTLSQADAFLLIYKDAPLMKWGLCPNKLYDYLGGARPVIFGMATPNNPVRDVNAGITVIPQDAADLARGIKQLAETSWEERVAMGQRGRAYVAEHHNFATLGTKLATTLTEIVSGSRPETEEQTSNATQHIRVIPTATRAPSANVQPVVIIGAPRSGTNMLRDVLTQLPGVTTWPCDEINYLWRIGNARHPDDALVPRQATDRVQKSIRRAFRQLAKREQASIVVEKTCANSLRVGFVDRVLPDAKYLFLVRDGRDAVASAMKRWTAPLDLGYVLEKAKYIPLSDIPYYGARYVSHRIQRLWSRERRLPSWGPRFPGMAELLATRTLPEVCAAQWATCVTEAEVALEKIPTDRVFQLKYEDFVAQPEQNLERILKFLEIPSTAATRQVAVDQVSANSVGNWRNQFDDETLQKISPIIDEVLNRFDYEVFKSTENSYPSATRAAG